MRISAPIAVTVAALLAVCVPTFPAQASGQTPPPPTTSPALSPLHRELDGIVRGELSPYTNAAIKVTSLKTGETLYEHNPRLLVTPASNQKLFTAATALSVLGKEREVITTVSVDDARGTIFLKGCGDSLLTARDLAGLATAASEKLERNRTYRVVADLACFDDLYWGKGWMWDDEPESDEMYIAPLAIDHNTVTVTVTPGKKANAPAEVALTPETPLVTVKNWTVTGGRGDEVTVKATRRPGDRENVITVSGVIPAGGDAVVKHLSVWKPERIALAIFADALRARGIAVTGLDTNFTTPQSRVIARKKRPLGDLVAFGLKESDNLSAESLIKLLGMVSTGQPGSAEDGASRIRVYLDKLGIPTDKLFVADGSGVSRYNLTNVETIIRLLEAIYRDQRIYPTVYNALPVAGRDGTLAHRMAGTPAEGNVRGKTGNMTGVSSLSGYLHTADGEPLAFSMVIENFAGPAKPVLEIQERILLILCSFHR
ncbi:D-alanyl-D-alanine carboxypeptidase/D-alanyl-D-alanine-endopeptidase [Geomonas sp. Red32]|uniref:D-alanyl-D-alanine carboxypeptidase/D-alanyl-D-alanine endopeptidase n=1 Tax=Geomonas sp. Red32 TaxID=2912856 RepID=UPI00202CB636|nr:D-alanyl-D-alanine carboxypeptidase/D-alanyl-D-alanine-endopeptidase [Geomonas sp. Red32]MCM0080333.1 D-alanyl-D-alanine carboxypeptidase/D-alanyl-D-alanine-endopeptidase [Geomonas sp. Red32]